MDRRNGLDGECGSMPPVGLPMSADTGPENSISELLFSRCWALDPGPSRPLLDEVLAQILSLLHKLSLLPKVEPSSW